MSEVFGSASDYSSSGIDSLAQAQDAYSNQGSSFGPPQNTDQQAEQVIQNILSNVGNRSNIRGSTNYNPIFAQALNMSRGLQPGNRVGGDYFGADNFQGIADLARPSYLTPQVPGEKGMYFSGGERFLQETLPPIIQGVREISPTGIIMNLIQQGQDAYNKGKDLYDETFKDTPFKRFNYDNEQKAKQAGINPIQISAPAPLPTQFDQFGNVVGSSILDYSGRGVEPLADIQQRRNDIERIQQNASRVGQLLEEQQDRGIMQNIDRDNVNDVQRALIAGFDNARMNPVQIDPNLQTAGLNLDDVQKFVTSPGVVGEALDYAQPYIQNLLPDNVNVDTGLIYNQEKPEDSYTGIKFTIPFN